MTFAFIIYSQKFNSEKLVFTHHYLHLLCVVMAHGLGETGGPVDSVGHLCGRELSCGEWEASSAVLKVTVTRSEAMVLECARFIERHLNNYFCGKMWCSNY